MITGTSKHEVAEHISRYDAAKTEADGATVFLIGVLDLDLKVHLQDSAMAFSSEGIIVNRSNHKLAEAMRFGVRGWKNYKDPKGNDIPFKTITRIVNGKPYDYMDQETANAVSDMKIVQELGNKVLVVNEMTAADTQGFTTP